MEDPSFPVNDSGSDAARSDAENEQREPPKTIQENEMVSREVRPLRYWPALALVLVMLALRVGIGALSDPPIGLIFARFLGPAAVALVILLWWLFFSRAPAWEKLAGAVGMAASLGLTHALSDKSVGPMGMLLFAVPWGTAAFAVGTSCARSLPWRRTLIGLAAAGVASGYWTLVRVDAIHGDFSSVERWRWEPSPEDVFLEKLAARKTSSKESPSEEAAVPLAESEWPGFRGANRRGEQPAVALVENWERRPPKELWRIAVGPGWSSFAVAGGRLFTQEQRGEREVVVCYDAEDGRELWVHHEKSRFWESVGGAGPRATPTIADGALFAL
ncbi:MAG: PQQ-like beta-propeller repeat protein, partial [Planctomycetales bacterium]